MRPWPVPPSRPSACPRHRVRPAPPCTSAAPDVHPAFSWRRAWTSSRSLPQRGPRAPALPSPRTGPGTGRSWCPRTRPPRRQQSLRCVSATLCNRCRRSTFPRSSPLRRGPRRPWRPRRRPPERRRPPSRTRDRPFRVRDRREELRRPRARVTRARARPIRFRLRGTEPLQSSTAMEAGSSHRGGGSSTTAEPTTSGSVSSARAHGGTNVARAADLNAPSLAASGGKRSAGLGWLVWLLLVLALIALVAFAAWIYWTRRHAPAPDAAVELQ